MRCDICDYSLDSQHCVCEDVAEVLGKVKEMVEEKRAARCPTRDCECGGNLLARAVTAQLDLMIKVRQ